MWLSTGTRALALQSFWDLLFRCPHIKGAPAYDRNPLWCQGDPRHPVLVPRGVTVIPTAPEAHLPVGRAELPSTQLTGGWATQAQRVPKAFPYVPGPPRFPTSDTFLLSSDLFSHLCLDNPANLKSALLPMIKVMLLSPAVRSRGL